MVLVSPFLRHLLRFLCFIVLFLFSRCSLALLLQFSRFSLGSLFLFSCCSPAVLSLFSRCSVAVLSILSRFPGPRKRQKRPLRASKSTESNGKKNAPPSARRRRAPAKFLILDPQNRPKSGAKKHTTRRAPKARASEIFGFRTPKLSGGNPFAAAAAAARGKPRIAPVRGWPDPLLAAAAATISGKDPCAERVTTPPTLSKMMPNHAFGGGGAIPKWWPTARRG